ncbi:DNA repair protein RadC [Lutibacter oricola]|uniref:DNA repair protein RadC n=1 Tax=Lutibacter oricola TaxID=762486 RepID=A0A1H2WMS1_9FLAO|nr:JAB domain-containing protein [Lutibacter oricola]SDW81940.1 DNA repair protein RadC [Lutibacter oricola]
MAKDLTKINQVILNYKRPHISKLPKLYRPSDAIEKLRSVIDENILDLKEYYWVLLLTSDNRLLGITELNSGGILDTTLNIREIIQLALLSNAVKIVLIHNHPSGNLEPSQKDIMVTNQLKRICELMEIYLEDHLIITSESFTSIKAKLN